MTSIEILDYEKVTYLVDESKMLSIGICSCKHGKFHLEEKECDVPLDTCASLGIAADYLIRRNLAKKVSKSEMLDNLTRSKEFGLVYKCCKCC
jgi:hypothetical protein